MPLAARTRLGPYEILSPLGAGGMGEVYKAKDTRLERTVAVKVLPQAVANDPDALARFEREAKSVAALSHPNILAIHDFGTQDGTAYVVTELLEGETLSAKLASGPIPPKQAVGYALQVAKGLAAAHEKGVIHRDLKPDNVFVTKDGHVKILDFGLAKRQEKVAPGEETSAPTASGHTEPGTVMGTVGYMSPEQVRGLRLDHRTDIFSFGAILYEMLSGQKAFKRDTAVDTMSAITRDEPPELTGSGRNVSPALDHLVRHCLEKDRERRFYSAHDVAFALSEASSPSGTAVAQDRTRGRKLAIAAVAVVVLAAVGLFLWKRPKVSLAPSGVKRIAVLPFENLGSSEDDYFADGIADQIRGKLTTLPAIEVIARGSSMPYKKTTKTPQEIAHELSANYLLTATVRWQKGNGQNRVQVNPELVEIRRDIPPASKWQQPFDANLTDVFQVQSEIATKVAQALGVALGAGEEKRLSEKPTQNLSAYDAYLKGEEASLGLSRLDPTTLRKALGFYEQAVALDPGFAQAWARISVANAFLYFLSTPTPASAERARQAAEKTVVLAPNRPESFLAVGYYKRIVLHDFRSALEQFANGRRVAPSNADLARASGATEMSLGEWDSALESFHEAQRLDPRSPANFRATGEALMRLRRYRQAREAIDHGLALSPADLQLIQYRAMTFLGEGDLEAARESVAAVPKSVDPTELVAFMANFNDLGWTLTEEQRELLLRLTPNAFDEDRAVWGLCLAQAYALRGDVSKMRSSAEEARTAFSDQLRTTPDDAQRHALLGLSLAYLGRKQEAIQEGKRAVELLPVTRDPRDAPYDQHQLVRIYMLVGEPEKALDQLEPLLKIPYTLSPGWLKIDPNFDPLRNNPRFQKLVAGK